LQFRLKKTYLPLRFPKYYCILRELQGVDFEKT